MTATTSTAPAWAALNSGKPAFLRYYAYLGFLIGIAALALLTDGGYNEDTYIFKLMSLAGGGLWGVGGALIGVAAGFMLSLAKPESTDSRIARNLLPWLDGILLLLVIAWGLSLLEPNQSLVTYEDQSKLISGRIIMAMNVLFIFAAVSYVMHLFAPAAFIGRMGTLSAWIATYAGGSALILRWYESYLIDTEIGHAPVSNLYEVFILLFCFTSAIYLVMERRYQARAMGAFVMLLVAGGVFFAIWLESLGQADIKPLVPALQSYWMKIHVPLNFIGYGAFAVACAAGMTYLLRDRLERSNPNGRMLSLFPSLDQLDQLAYKSVAIGFPAFTLATILGAAWAAEAWGGYWSWDPKETWALIVWLFYGAYLHVRVSHGWSGKTLAWWAVAGFLVTLFCFVGVNMYLSGLHSYGRLS